MAWAPGAESTRSDEKSAVALDTRWSGWENYGMAAETDWRERETRLRRRKDMIHLPSCRYAPGALPWLWAEDHSDAVVVASAVRTNGLTPCRVCKPFSDAR